MNINLTVREIFDKGLWESVCELKGISDWAVNEGLMEMDEEITFSQDEWKKLTGMDWDW